MASNIENNAQPTGMEIQPQDLPIEHQPISGMPSSSRRERRPTKSVEKYDAFFRLFQFQDKNEFILEILQATTSNVISKHLLVIDENKRFPLAIGGLSQGDYHTVPVVEDRSIPIFPKRYPLSLQERLDGWEIEKRVRADEKKTELFYRHRNRKFRSLITVAVFILFSCDSEDLKLISIVYSAIVVHCSVFSLFTCESEDLEPLEAEPIRQILPPGDANLPNNDGGVQNTDHDMRENTEPEGNPATRGKEKI